MPHPRELFIDVDSDAEYEAFVGLLAIFKEHERNVEHLSRPSRSGLPHRHIIVTLNRDVKDERERILLQATLGSDKRRELLSWAALEAGHNLTPTLFFEAYEPISATSLMVDDV